MDDPELEKILERLAVQETNMQWVIKEVNRLSKEIGKLRWELVSGVLILVVLQILMRLLG
jgi:tetrahydromethanopterin S-methyltransferase subunit G